tara:strand:- start:84 stop:275 length:192 start_codon:yes stop_codon:yes gene_type:complete
MSEEKDFNLCIWKLKKGFEEVSFSESDYKYYRAKHNIADDAIITIVNPDGSIRNFEDEIYKSA